MSFFSTLKRRLGFEPVSEMTNSPEEDYVEIDTKRDISKRNKIQVKPFIIENFEDIKETLDALREGYTIALVNIKPLKDRDITELKRAVNKIKKTCDAIEGDIAGFGEDWIVVTPSFAQVYRNPQTTEEIREDKSIKE
ncbi:MAG TPA: cell division protein SepF [Candidatus Nanoarchaeia archaeon]|nr:cell division protein SepF [Candidatus Nanoarchaeia archaeon]